MSRSKLCLLLCLCLPIASARAQSPNLISEDMIRAETVHYSKTAVVEMGEYARDFSTSASEYYPHTVTLAAQTDGASFVQYHVSRGQQVQQGDLLATFALETDEAAHARATLSLERAREDYEAEAQTKREEIAAMLQAHAAIRDSQERELDALRIRRAQTAYQQYCYQQSCAIDRLSRQLARLEEASTRSHLYAPFDGVITALAYKREGERVYPHEGLVTLHREEDMLLRISNDQLHFRYGMSVTVTGGSKADPQTYQGQVVAADNMLGESRRQGYAYIRLEPFENGEKPRFARLTATGVSEYLADVMVVPRRAVTMDGGRYCVECLVNGSLQKRYINAGLMNMAHVWVLQGLRPGDTIIID